MSYHVPIDYVAGRSINQHRDGSLHVHCPRSRRRSRPRRITVRCRVKAVHESDDRQGQSVAWHATRGAPGDLEARLDPDFVDDHGWTPLHHAAAGGCYAHVQIILKTHEDVNKREKLNGWTAVHLAVIGMHDKVLRLLLENGGRRDVEDNYGVTPSDMRPRFGISDRATAICRLLAETCSSEST